MSSYSVLRRNFWDDREMVGLGEREQLLLIYLLVGPHVTTLNGLWRVGEASLAEARGLRQADIRTSLARLADAGLVAFDGTTRVIWVPSAITHDPPRNVNVLKAWDRLWDDIPECHPKTLAHVTLARWAEHHFGAHFETMEMASWTPRETVSKPSANRIETVAEPSRNRLETVSILIPDLESNSGTPASASGSAPAPASLPAYPDADAPVGAASPGELFPDLATVAKNVRTSRASKPRGGNHGRVGDVWTRVMGGEPNWKRLGVVTTALLDLGHPVELIEQQLETYLTKAVQEADAKGENPKVSPEYFKSIFRGSSQRRPGILAEMQAQEEARRREQP